MANRMRSENEYIKKHKLRTDRGNHSVYKLYYHLILVTKFRKKCITEEVFQCIRSHTERIFEMNGCTIVEMNYEPDHVHILFSATPKIALSNMVNGLKSSTSRHVREEFQEHLSQYYWVPVFWSRSYMLLSSGGAPIEIIREYIRNQSGSED